MAALCLTNRLFNAICSPLLHLQPYIEGYEALGRFVRTIEQRKGKDEVKVEGVSDQY